MARSDRVEELERENAELRAKLVEGRISDAFDRSKFIAERLLVPADMLAKRFGGAFTVEGERVVALDANKSLIMSRENPAEVASFDEAIEILVAYGRRAGG